MDEEQYYGMIPGTYTEFPDEDKFYSNNIPDIISKYYPNLKNIKWYKQDNGSIVVKENLNSYDETWNYILNAANPYFGIEYQYGAKDPLTGKLDCSGFSEKLCKKFGSDIGEGTINLRNAGESVPLDAPLENGYAYLVISKGSGPSERHVYFEGPNGIILDCNSTPTLEGATTGVGTRKNPNSKIIARRRIPIKDFIQSNKIGGTLYYIKSKLIPRKRYIK